MKRICTMFVLGLMTAISLHAYGSQDPRVLSLAGQWRFCMSGPEADTTQQAIPQSLAFDDTIELPGTTETRRKGEEHGPGWTGQLTRVWRFDGAAWYQRDITIPDSWRGKRITLFLERTKYAQVWLDNKPIGESPILCTPQEYVLGTLEPGAHRLTIMADNRRRPVPGDNHQTSDNTQGNWNGILGRIELRATDAVWMDDVQIAPDAAKRAARVKVQIGNASRNTGKGTITLSAGKIVTTREVSWTAGGANAEFELQLEGDAALWDEFNPALHTLRVELRGPDIADDRTISFGLRDFATKGTQFTINGRPTLLRGKHDACVFPLTGHPPMDVEGWLRYFRTCQQWGINHVRFHSWTPPEAAFTAADQLGIYLQTELPFWGDFTDEIKAALKPEAEQILRHYGNHPSFVMMTMGNENRHSREIMGSLVSELRTLDGRRLYAQGSNNFLWDPWVPEGDDYIVTGHVKAWRDALAHTVRGGHNTSDPGDGHVQNGPANTMKDYSSAIRGVGAPVVAHEVGQYTVYPEFAQIAKYTGVMRAANLEHFRKRLQDAGMIAQADAFSRASGQLALLCYREEIEAALRTPGFGGFQMLDLQDFPGQGTALVGMLDAFMDSKGIVPAEQWRQFCSPIVLLARFDRYTWTGDQTFEADVQIAHYGRDELSNATVGWMIRDAAGEVVASGTLPPARVERGNVRPIGRISTAISSIASPARLSLELSLDGTELRTSYPIWVYPPSVAIDPPAGVTIARKFDAGAREALARGGRVVLIADASQPLARTVGGAFATDFWCWPMFHNKPGTMGLLCDPSHPALAGFPTEYHSNWQWFYLARDAQPLILDDLPQDLRPIVQVIDNFDRVHKLGLVFEAKVGAGKLLMCATDLVAMRDKPEARQLLASLLAYAGSNAFDPTTEIPVDRLRELLTTTIRITGKPTASSQAKGWPSRPPLHAIDGNEATFWLADETPDSSGQWWRIDFDTPQQLPAGAEILWNKAKPGQRYMVETSGDGNTWTTACEASSGDPIEQRQRLDFTATGVRAVRVRIQNAERAGIREIRFFQDTD